jgi:serine/threonine protein kinase
VVMEQGIENLEQHLKKYIPLLRTEKTAIAHKVALIVEAAHKSNICLMDFKPSNIVRFKDDRDMPVWKAIDFDSSHNLDEDVLKDVTPGVCSYEMAKYHSSEPGQHKDLTAQKSMDICSLGWTIDCIFSGGDYFWKDDGSTSILSEMATVTQDGIVEKLNTRHPGPLNSSLRNLLKLTLNVDPKARCQIANVVKSSVFLESAPTITGDEVLRAEFGHIKSTLATLHSVENTIPYLFVVIPVPEKHGLIGLSRKLYNKVMMDVYLAFVCPVTVLPLCVCMKIYTNRCMYICMHMNAFLVCYDCACLMLCVRFPITFTISLAV